MYDKVGCAYTQDNDRTRAAGDLDHENVYVQQLSQSI